MPSPSPNLGLDVSGLDAIYALAAYEVYLYIDRRRPRRGARMAVSFWYLPIGQVDQPNESGWRDTFTA